MLIGKDSQLTVSGGLVGGTKASISSKNSSEVTVGERSTELSSNPIKVIAFCTFTDVDSIVFLQCLFQSSVLDNEMTYLMLLEVSLHNATI